MARKRLSRTSRAATRRKVSDNRYREWSEIHNDYKLVDENGTRLVLYNGESGGAVLGPWIGPDGNRSARRNKRASLTLTLSDITWTARERQPGFFWVDGTDSEGYHYEQGLVPASSAREAIEEMESGYQYSLRQSNRVRRANRRWPHPVQHRANRKRAMTDYDVQVVADAIFEFHFNNSQDEFDEIYEDDTHLVYEVIERYLDETGEEYDDYDVTEIASFIAGGNSSW